jgi:hypothetical protein
MIWTTGFDSRQKQGIFPLLQSVRQPSLLCSGYLGAVSPGVKRPVSDANHSSPANTGFKNGGTMPPLSSSHGE